MHVRGSYMFSTMHPLSLQVPIKLVLRPLDGLDVDTLLDHLPQRAHFAQLLHVLHGEVHRAVHLVVRGKAADPKADRGVRELLFHAEGTQHVRGLQGRRRACRAGRDRDVLQAHEETFALHVRERQVDVPWVAVLAAPVEHHVRELLPDPVLEARGQPGHVGGVARHLLRGHGARLPQPHHQRRGHRAAAEPALLPPSVDDGLHAHAGPPPHVQGAHALGPVELVARDGHEIDVHGIHVQLNLARRLGRIRVEENLVLAANRPDVRHGLDHADLVVHCHDRHNHGILPDRGLELREVHQPIRLHREVGDVKARLLELAARVEDALVVSLRGDDMLLLLAVEVGHALDGHVVRLSRARGEDDLLRVGPDESRDLRAGHLCGVLALPAVEVGPRVRVTILIDKEGQH
mmetsp:Transcript_11703/g.37170  ORF Transcript_11703/g.37170 Transcript_11703/m.37170 type:complete len:405 (-) Transcript_11703:257-1471(-)